VFTDTLTKLDKTPEEIGNGVLALMGASSAGARMAAGEPIVTPEGAIIQTQWLLGSGAEAPVLVGPDGRPVPEGSRLATPQDLGAVTSRGTPSLVTGANQFGVFDPATQTLTPLETGMRPRPQAPPAATFMMDAEGNVIRAPSSTTGAFGPVRTPLAEPSLDKREAQAIEDMIKGERAGGGGAMSSLREKPTDEALFNQLRDQGRITYPPFVQGGYPAYLRALQQPDRRPGPPQAPSPGSQGSSLPTAEEFLDEVMKNRSLNRIR
jgi:hypothetical protein